MMKNKLLFYPFKLICAALLFAASSLSLAQTVPLDTVVAVVDNDVIMASELEQRLNRVMAQIKANNTQVPPIEVVRSQLLEQLIVESLQLQMAQRAGVNISDDELDQAIARIAESKGVSQKAFMQQVAAGGMSTSAIREQIRREMLIDRIQSGSVNRRIHISDQEVDNFLASKQGELFASPDYHLGHLFIAVSSSASSSEVASASDKANNLYQQLTKGADFRSLAIANSDGEKALEGGDLGWRKTSQMPELFAKAISGKNAGYVTKPLRSPAGFHLLKVHDVRGAQQQIVEQAKVRHILIKPSSILSDEEARAKLSGIRTHIINGASFADMAKEHSEDVGSMLSGGELGWSLPGQFVPEFEQTMQKTPTGSISAPFRTQFGWHILQVTERRNQDMSEEFRRNQARSLLHKRRFEEERINWLQEIRDEAFVDIKS